MNTIRKVNFLDKTTYSIDGRDCLLYLTGKPAYILVQPVDDHDREVLDEQVTAIAGASPAPFVFVAFPVTDWNGELSPWDSPAVFGPDDFGHGAAGTLRFVEKELLPAVRIQFHLSDEVPVILGGYFSGSSLFFVECLADRYLFGGRRCFSFRLVPWLAGIYQSAAANDESRISESG